MGKSKRQKKIDEIRENGGVVPVGLFGTALPAAALNERLEHGRSGAAGAHQDSSLRRDAAAGRKGRVATRRTQILASIRDQA